MSTHKTNKHPLYFFDGHISIWSVPDRKLKLRLPALKRNLIVGAMSFSPDGKNIVCFIHPFREGKHELRLYSVANGREVWQQQSVMLQGSEIVFSPDGRWLIIPTDDDRIKLCDARTGKFIKMLPSKWPVDNRTLYTISSAERSKTGFTGDGRFLVLRGRHEIYIWNMDEVNAQFAPDVKPKW